MTQDMQTPVPAGPPGKDLAKQRAERLAQLRAKYQTKVPVADAAGPMARPVPTDPPGDREARLEAGREALRAQQLAEIDQPRPATTSVRNKATTSKAAPKSEGSILDRIQSRLDEIEWLPKFFLNVWVVLGVLIAVMVIAIVGITMLGGFGPATAQGVAVSTQTAPPPSDSGVFGFDVQGPPAINVMAKVTLATVWFTLLLAFGFAETISRRERFALDFWAPILFVGVAVFRKQLSHDLWLSLQMISGTLVVAAIALNENRPVGGGGKSIWAQIFNLVTGAIDMTPLYQIGALLLALGYAKWTILPYPTWIDPKIAWALLVVGALFEISRAPVPTLIAVVLGGVAGFLFDPWLTMGAALIVIVMGAIFHSVGWLPATSHHGEGTVGAMGRNLTVALRWDLVLLATITYFLVAITAHGDVVIYTITRLAGG